jgi:hypothetical protein
MTYRWSVRSITLLMDGWVPRMNRCQEKPFALATKGATYQSIEFWQFNNSVRGTDVAPMPAQRDDEEADRLEALLAATKYSRTLHLFTGGDKHQYLSAWHL